MRNARQDTRMFHWFVDSAGYSLHDGWVIPLGGAIRPYLPEKTDPSPHYLFAKLNEQIGETREIQRPKRTQVARNEFWTRRFPDMEAAILEFVREYGLLRSPSEPEHMGTLIGQQQVLAYMYDESVSMEAKVKYFNADMPLREVRKP